MKRDDDAAMDPLLHSLQTICKSLPDAQQYVMVHHPAFRVGKKPFAILGMNEHVVGPTLSINLGRDAQDSLLGDHRFIKTPYLGQHGWVTITASALKKGELEQLVRDSYLRVAGKKQLARM